MGTSISSNMPAILMVAAGLCLLGIVGILAREVFKLRKRLDDITGGVEGGLEDALIANMKTVHEIGQDLDELTARTVVLESSSRHHLARQALLRFNPFPTSETGGNQSFALAVLDELDSGFVISSLHSRSGTRVYAKAVTAGKPDQPLGTEEEEALDQARAKRAKIAEASGRSARTAADDEPMPVRGSRGASSVPVATAKSAPTKGRPQASEPVSAPAPMEAVPAPTASADVAPVEVAPAAVALAAEGRRHRFSRSAPAPAAAPTPVAVSETTNRRKTDEHQSKGDSGWSEEELAAAASDKTGRRRIVSQPAPTEPPRS